MASQEFLASFGVEIDEGSVSRLQSVLSANRDLANEVAAAFEAARSAIEEYEKAAAGRNAGSGEAGMDNGSGARSSNTSYSESTHDTGSPYTLKALGQSFLEGLNGSLVPGFIESMLPSLTRDIESSAKGPDRPTPSSERDTESSGSLDLSGARTELDAFREEASQPIDISGNAAELVTAAQKAYNEVAALFSRPIDIKANVKTTGNGGPPPGMSAGGRFTEPTDVQVAEDGDAEYIIPVRKEDRAVPLLRQLLAELTPAAREELGIGGELTLVSGEMPGTGGGLDAAAGGLQAGAAPVVTVTQESRNVSAPVTIQVQASGVSAEEVGQQLYDLEECYLLRTLKGAMA